MKQNLKIFYIKANGQYYYPQEPGVQDPKKIEGCFYPVCKIKKLWFGRFKIELYDEYLQFSQLGYSLFGEENKPNTVIILYPSGIEEIKYFNYSEPTL